MIYATSRNRGGFLFIWQRRKTPSFRSEMKGASLTGILN